MSPFNAFQFIQGIETLPLRIERQSQNAAKVSEFLENNKNVSKVIYPNNTDKNKKYFNKNLYGNLIGFHIDKGMKRVRLLLIN